MGLVKWETQVSSASSVEYGAEKSSTGLGFDPGGELALIVSRLAREIEQFDSMIRDQRHLLQQHGANLGRPDERVLRLQSQRITAHAAEIATQTQGALEELRGFSLPWHSDSASESSQQNPS